MLGLNLIQIRKMGPSYLLVDIILLYVMRDCL